MQVRLSKLVCYSTLAIGESSSQGDISTARHWRTRSARAALCIALGKTSTAHAAKKPITRRVRDAQHLSAKHSLFITQPRWRTSGTLRSVVSSTQNARARDAPRARPRAATSPRAVPSRDGVAS